VISLLKRSIDPPSLLMDMEKGRCCNLHILCCQVKTMNQNILSENPVTMWCPATVNNPLVLPVPDFKLSIGDEFVVQWHYCLCSCIVIREYEKALRSSITDVKVQKLTEYIGYREVDLSLVVLQIIHLMGYSDTILWMSMMRGKIKMMMQLGTDMQM
jgi:hypothetical protein